MPNRKEKEEESGEFKVVDRRMFTSEGEVRTDLPPEPPPPPAPTPEPAPPQSQPQASSSPAEGGAKERPATPSHAPGAVQFEHLIMSLVTTAMYQLGMAARPGEIAPPPDLPAARETIDLLAVIQEKTKGNLTHEEVQLLSGSLQELRLVYVEITRQSGRIP